MDMLLALWLPTILSAAAVWIAAAIAWTALPHHKHDTTRLPDENAFLAFMRSAGIRPGNYSFPYFASHKDARTPEAKALWKEGPMGMMTVMPTPNMGKNMVLSFLVYLAVSIGVAYLGSVALPRGATFAKVMQILGTAGILAYCFAFWPSGIWFAQKPRALIMCTIDGIAFGLITAAIFAALWPST